MRCNGGFRFAELLAFARRAGAARLATGHYARIVEHRGRLLLARAADERKDQSYMLARLDPALLDRIWFPLGEQTKAETRARGGRRRARRRRARARARRRASSPATTTATSSSGGASPRGRARSSTRRAASSARTTASGGSRPASGAGSASPPAEPLYALRTEPRTNTRRRRPARGARAHDDLAPAAGSTCPVDRAEAKLRYRSPAVAAAVEPTARGLPARARRARLRRRARPDRRALRGRRRRRRRHASPRSRRLGSAVQLLPPGATSRISRSPSSSSSSGSRSRYAFVRLGGTFGALSSFIKGTENGSSSPSSTRSEGRSTG